MHLRLHLRAALLLAVTTLMTASVTQGQTAVFINEIHYDNAGTDTGEFVEIAGPAGTDLSGWTLVLHNAHSITHRTRRPRFS